MPCVLALPKKINFNLTTSSRYANNTTKHHRFRFGSKTELTHLKLKFSYYVDDPTDAGWHSIRLFAFFRFNCQYVTSCMRCLKVKIVRMERPTENNYAVLLNDSIRGWTVQWAYLIEDIRFEAFSVAPLDGSNDDHLTEPQTCFACQNHASRDSPS